MKILFLISALNTGGIETFMFRIAEHTSHYEHQLVFLTMTPQIGKSLAEKIRQTGHQVICDVSFRYKILLSFLSPGISQNFLKVNKLENVDIIFATSLETFFAGLFIQKNLLKNAKLGFGIYAPFETSNPLLKNDGYCYQLTQKIIKNFPKSNIVFANEGMLWSYKEKMRVSFEDSPISPILVDLKHFFSIKREPLSYKIISVGRLVNFKTYNFTMIEVIKKLHTVDARFTYHIYGDGPQREELLSYIQANGAQNYVFLHGAISYEKLPEVFSDAYIFVGCGTSIIEASAAAIPSIIGVVNMKTPLTYGWFHDFNDDDFGEVNHNKQEKPIFDLIANLAASSSEKYHEQMLKAAQRAQHFNIDERLNDFYDVLKKLKKYENKLNRFDYFRFYMNAFFAKLAKIL